MSIPGPINACRDVLTINAVIINCGDCPLLQLAIYFRAFLDLECLSRLLSFSRDWREGHGSASGVSHCPFLGKAALYTFRVTDREVTAIAFCAVGRPETQRRE